MHPDLRYLAALHALGKLDPDAMKSAVDALMNQGFFSEECLEALDSTPARIDEVLPAFTAAIAHFGIVVPDQELAVWQVVAHHMHRITSEREDPWLALRDLFSDIYWDYDFQSRAREHLGDSHGIERLIGIYWTVDDQAENSHTEPAEFRPDPETMHSILRAAQDWMRTYGAQYSSKQLCHEQRSA